MGRLRLKVGILVGDIITVLEVFGILCRGGRKFSESQRRSQLRTMWEQENYTSVLGN